MKIALVGATGNVAGRAVQRLVETGARPVVLVRHPEKLPAPLRTQVHIEEGALEDAAFVVRATRGADALLWLTPTSFGAPDLHAHTLGLARIAARAIGENGIQRVVFLSSHGADRAGFGHVSFAGEVEQVLAAAAPHTMSMRSAGQMENLLAAVETLRTGRLFGVLPPDKKYPLVAARDVGDVAARWLLDPTWRGHQVRGVHGPQDLTPREQVDVVTRVLGGPVRYQQIPAEALGQALRQRGATPSVADAYTQLFRSYAQPDYRRGEPRTPETTTPTTFDEFVREILAPRLASLSRT